MENKFTKQLAGILGTLKTLGQKRTRLDWLPTHEQIWRDGMKSVDGSTLTAWRFYEGRFASTPYHKRPYIDQLRAHPKTRPFLIALAVLASRNKSSNRAGPKHINELFPNRPIKLECGGELHFNPHQ